MRKSSRERTDRGIERIESIEQEPISQSERAQPVEEHTRPSRTKVNRLQTNIEREVRGFRRLTKDYHFFVTLAGAIIFVLVVVDFLLGYAGIAGGPIMLVLVLIAAPYLVSSIFASMVRVDPDDVLLHARALEAIKARDSVSEDGDMVDRYIQGVEENEEYLSPAYGYGQHGRIVNLLMKIVYGITGILALVITLGGTALFISYGYHPYSDMPPILIAIFVIPFFTLPGLWYTWTIFQKSLKDFRFTGDYDEETARELDRLKQQARVILSSGQTR